MMITTSNSLYRILSTTLPLFVIFVASNSEGVWAESSEQPGIDFNREIRPILSDHCFACHGPDEHDRKADLRLDTIEGLRSILSEQDTDRDFILDRIHSEDSDVLMPPPEFQKPLTIDQKKILEKWLQLGATIERPWAFTSPEKPRVPEEIEKDSEAIDYFIQERIKANGLIKNPPAKPSELLRRVCLDLTGLPPSREQIDWFLKDPSPEAYEELVDDLLASPQFGEHFGRYWLDLVRYGDTHGLHLDNYREMWPFRDWVINALNENMPFDAFITQQLAGDLIPALGDPGLVASGFNRLNVTTNEGGSIYEEVFARNVMDRTDAFGTIFLGLTVGCAVCHDHKFDPISQRDYYALSAFFNSLDGRALDGNSKNPAPVIPVPTDEQKKLLAEYDQAILDFAAERQGPIESVDQAQATWERSLSDNANASKHVIQPSSVESSSQTQMEILGDGSFRIAGEAADQDTTTIVAPLPTGTSWQTLQLEALVDSENDKVGVSENGNVVLTEITLEIGNPMTGKPWTKIPPIFALADVEQQDGPFDVRYAIDSSMNDREGWAAAGHQDPGGRNAWFVFAPLDSGEDELLIRIQLHYQSVFAKHQFKHVKLTLSDSNPSIPANQQVTLGPIFSVGPFPIENPNPGYGRSFASQGKAFDAEEIFNYQETEYRWKTREDLGPVSIHTLPSIVDRSSALMIYQNLKSPKPQKVTLLCDVDDGLMVFLNGKEISNRRGPHPLNPLEQEIELNLKKGSNDLYLKVINHEGTSRFSYAYRSPAIPIPSELISITDTPSAQRSDETNASLRRYYRSVFCLHPDWLALLDLENGTRKARESLEKNVATTLIWKEIDPPRTSHILIRGQYDQPGDAVERSVPEFLSPFPNDSPRNRLGLAKWLTGEQNPLTARVAVNRFWQQLFGTGLVKTSEDFGSQGEPPSHPKLLDWLAVDFRTNQWDVKRLIRMIVTSETYRTSHEITPELQQKDPYNRLLARGPRYRLDAEILRDQALFLSGLLQDERGGPSVKPPQPDGLWAAVGYSGSNTVKFRPDQGDKIYRRSVYTFWKRTSPPPQMTMLDAPSRESCTARRERTNTPLQALLLLNEQQFLESAKKLAERVESELDEISDSEKINWLFQTITTRLPSDLETEAIHSLLADSQVYYEDQTDLCTALVGEPNARKAAWTLVCNTLLNLDEVVSK